MNRRSFLQIIAAAAALPFFPKIKPVRRVVGFEYAGFTFMEDPNPLRFILTPQEPYKIEDLESTGVQWRSNINSIRDIAGIWDEVGPDCPPLERWIPNPAYATALQPLMAYHPDAVRRFEGCGGKVGVKSGPRRA